MSGRFDEDLTRWERGEISLIELAARHPEEDVFGLAALYLRLATAGSEPTTDPADGWGAVGVRLLDPAPRTLHRLGRWTTRPVMVAAVVTLLTAGLALAIEPLRRGTASFFTEAAEVLAQSGISNPLSLVLAPLRADPLRADGYEDHFVEWIPSVSYGDRPTCMVVGGPAHGRANVNPDCSRGKYIPDPNFNGTDSFWYAASDGTRVSAAAQVQVMLQSVNDPPVAADDDFVTEEDTAVVVDVLANDYDVDDDSLPPPGGELAEEGGGRDLTIGAVVGAEGTVTVAGDGLDLVYNPPPDF
ncbi:MAG: Ig-like domain-containing protein, partial [Actinomycetota bacterium]